MDQNLSVFLKFRKTTIVFSILMTLGFDGVANVQRESDENRIKAYRTYESVEIDGELTEADWQHAEPMQRFVQIKPHEGENISEPLEIRILYDAKKIYFGFTCFDSDMSKLVANEMHRDSRDLHENDSVFLLLDTYNDRRSGFFFRVNALGAIQDRAVTNNGDTFNPDWDAVVECKSKINDTYWTAELSIPFNQLRFKRSTRMTWGINAGRGIVRHQEEAIWVPVPATYGGMAKYRTANLGTLVGIEGIAPTRNLEFLPYVLPGITYTRDEETALLQTKRQLKLGFDTKYGIISNLTADITYNTDFAQVEADQEQVNLTRFSLFFPEKRPFFLEGGGLFDFGIPRTSFRGPPPLLLFYSRQIGLDEANAIPIIFGGKITGKVGTYGIGILNVLTDPLYNGTPDEPVNIPRTNYSVLRVTKDIAAGSRIGIISVNKDQRAHYNRAGGADFEYRPSDRLDIRGLWARTFERGMSGQNNAWYLGTRWRNDHFRAEGTYTDIDEDFNPEVGYVRRFGIRRARAELRWVPKPQKYGIREILIGPEINYTLNRDNELEQWNASYVHWFSFSTGDSLFLQAQRTFEQLDEEFEIREEAIIPIGHYEYNTFGGRLSTSDARPISASTRVDIGDFYNGQIHAYSLNTTLKPNAQIRVDVSYQFKRVALPTGKFDANLFNTRLNYSFSTGLFAKLFTQWNTESGIVSANLLINYIYRPGSDFYFVFNQTYDTDSTTKSMLLDSTIVAKMTYWWNP